MESEDLSKTQMTVSQGRKLLETLKQNGNVWFYMEGYVCFIIEDGSSTTPEHVKKLQSSISVRSETIGTQISSRTSYSSGSLLFYSLIHRRDSWSLARMIQQAIEAHA